MREFSKIGEELFNKLRGRFPSVTIGDAEGNVTNEPIAARYFDFDYNGLGKVSVNLDEDEGLTVIFSKDFVEGTSDTMKQGWHNFLKELRVFGKKRMLEFSVRDITKSNLDKRDYKFLATNRSGDDNMNESKLYGTSRISYQNVGEARIMIKHTESVNQETSMGRTRSIGKIYIESADGERFRYPFKHLSGARAMARHVAEGGKPHDEFGGHIVGLSEEMAKLRKFKNYMGRSAVMAESLAGYTDIVKERIATVKKTIESLQKPAYYTETFAAFETPVFEDVPTDVSENWIDELTIKQFNEELADVFPYIYKLIGEATKATDLGPDELEEVAGPKDCWDGYKKDGTQAGTGKNKGKRVNKCVPEEAELEQGFEEMMGQFSEAKADEAEEIANEEELSKCCDAPISDGPGDAKGRCTSCGDVVSADEGNAYAHAVKTAKMNGKKKGDKIDGPDGDEIKLEKDQKTPLGEFILSYFDRENGQFPKGETAVLTMVEKDYGEQFIEPAKAFIEQVTAKFDEWQMRSQPQQMEASGPCHHCSGSGHEMGNPGKACLDCGGTGKSTEKMEAPDTSEYDRIRELAGLR
jgi:hypothetical protein